MGVAVDGGGDVFVADYAAGAIFRETLSGGSYIQSTVATGFAAPAGVAVDNSGNLYVADGGLDQDVGPYGAVYKETVSGATYTRAAIGSSWSNPTGIALDSAGNIYVSEDNWGEGGLVNKETLQSNGSYTQTALVSRLASPEGVAVDSSGNVLLVDAESDSAYKEDVADPPALTFASTVHGSISKDSPKTVTVGNLGNAALSFLALSLPADFPETAPLTGECKAAVPLAAGATCTITVSFKPVTSLGGKTSLPLAETVTLTTNTLNTKSTERKLAASGTETSN